MHQKNNTIHGIWIAGLLFCSAHLSAMKEDKKVYSPELFKEKVSGSVEDLKRFFDEIGDVHAYDSEGNTLLAHAHFEKKPDYVDALLKKGASFECFVYQPKRSIKEGGEGEYENLLHLAISSDNLAEVKSLLSFKNVDPNKKMWRQESPLAFVIRKKNA